jgi:hypothetical protein
MARFISSTDILLCSFAPDAIATCAGQDSKLEFPAFAALWRGKRNPKTRNMFCHSDSAILSSFDIHALPRIKETLKRETESMFYAASSLIVHRSLVTDYLA